MQFRYFFIIDQHALFVLLFKKHLFCTYPIYGQIVSKMHDFLYIIIFFNMKITINGFDLPQPLYILRFRLCLDIKDKVF